MVFLPCLRASYGPCPPATIVRYFRVVLRAIIARRLALAVVQSGTAREATVHLASFPGDEAPRILRIATPDGDLREPQRWGHLVECTFNTAASMASGEDLLELARWGHLGGSAMDGRDQPESSFELPPAALQRERSAGITIEVILWPILLKNSSAVLPYVMVEKSTS